MIWQYTKSNKLFSGSSKRRLCCKIHTARWKLFSSAQLELNLAGVAAKTQSEKSSAAKYSGPADFT
jgi:hypothetical protein